MKRHRLHSLALCAVAAVTLAACGDKAAPAASAPVAAPAAPSPKAKAPVSVASESEPNLPSVADKLGEYRVVDFSKDIDEKEFEAYRQTFLHAAAAVPKLDPKVFPYVVSEAAGREADAFKREDIAKEKAPEVNALLAAPYPKLELRNGPKFGSTFNVSLSSYDMDLETYKVSFPAPQPSISYSWVEDKQERSYGFAVVAPSMRCFGVNAAVYGCTPDRVVKIPKEQARAIEAQVASRRDATSKTVSLPVGLFVTPVKLQEGARWDKAMVDANLDAVGVYLVDKPMDKPLFVIDGPELMRR